MSTFQIQIFQIMRVFILGEPSYFKMSVIYMKQGALQYLHCYWCGQKCMDSREVTVSFVDHIHFLFWFLWTAVLCGGQLKKQMSSAILCFLGPDSSIQIPTKSGQKTHLSKICSYIIRVKRDLTLMIQEQILQEPHVGSFNVHPCVI